MMTRETQGTKADRHESTAAERRGRRVEVSGRLFFFGSDDFEGEGRVLDFSTSGCRASSSVELES